MIGKKTYDCSNIHYYMHEAERMCEDRRMKRKDLACHNCPLYSLTHDSCAMVIYPKDDEEWTDWKIWQVQDWSNKHPEKELHYEETEDNVYAVVDEDDEMYFGIQTNLPIDAVIDIINHTKQNLPGEWSTEDIILALPKECSVIDIERIYI